MGVNGTGSSSPRLFSAIRLIDCDIMDKISPQRRSDNMRRIRDRNTAPEMRVRSALHRFGLRFRLHRRDLPGRPDIVFPSRRACVLVHGCFWHGCELCVDGQRSVQSNTSYWAEKISRNRSRDVENLKRLKANGWRVFIIWECQTGDAQLLNTLARTIRAIPTP